MFLAIGSGPRTSHVLFERGRRHFWQGAAGLSIKSFRGGRALYDVGGGSLAVDEEHYLLLNEGQTYSIAVDAREPVESFCVFFGKGQAAEATRCLTASAERLLDEPAAAGPPVGFVERTYRHDETVSPALSCLRSALAAGPAEAGRLEEMVQDLLDRLVGAQGLVRREADALPGLRRSTREEIYRRLHRARDHAAASVGRRVGLDELAGVACLSPSHFLRSFRQLFGQTPHQYLMNRRLARARELLLSTDLPVTQVCLEVGFESLGTFSTLFRRRAGASPASYRRRGAKGDFGEAPGAGSSYS